MRTPRTPASRWTVGLSALFLCLTLGIWISATVAYRGSPLPWTPTALLACGLHLAALAAFGVLPKPASYIIIAVFCIDCAFTADYASIQQYGVFLALGHLGFSEPVRRSAVALAAPIVACAVCVWTGGMFPEQFFTSTTCHCLAYIAGLAMRAITQDHALRRGAEIMETRRMRDDIARGLHDAVTNELTSIILLCDAEDDASRTESRNIPIIRSQAERALRNTQRAILALHGSSPALAGDAGVGDVAALRRFVAIQDGLLDAMGFHGAGTFELHADRPPSRTLVDDATSVVKEIYANIARHCPPDGAYHVRVDVYGSSIRIEESNPYLESAADRFSSGFGLRHIRTIAGRSGGSCLTSTDGRRWTVRVCLRDQQ